MDTEIYKSRWEKARALSGGALLLTPSSDLYYFSGYRGHVSERLCCFALTESDAYLVYPGFEENYINDELKSMAECLPWNDGDDPYKKLSAVLEQYDEIAVGAAMSAVSLLSLQERLPGRRWINGETITGQLRMIKDDTEYELLREAQNRASSALEKLYAWGIEGRTEAETAARLNEFIRAEGMETADWGPIVASGPNGASPHHETSERIIVRGEPVVIDFGGVYKGYQADITRTPFTGRASAECRDVYQIVLDANEAAFRAAVPGSSCDSVDAAARGVISRAGFGRYFTHRLGHGLGLDTHEEPYMVGGSSLAVAPGMCFSDEPGVYLSGRFGVRIEDILFEGEGGAERLTPFKRGIVEL